MREAHGRTIEEMAEATGIRLPFLTALEQDAFDSLPGRGFGKLYIRAYSEVLGFDPRPMIDAYDRAIRELDAAAPASEPEGSSRPANGVLARWRSELIARRAEAGDSGGSEEDLTFDLLEPVAEAGAGSGRIEEPRMSPAPATAGPVETVSPSRPAQMRWWPGAALLAVVLLPLTAYFVSSKSSRSTRALAPVAARQEPAVEKSIAPPPSLPPKVAPGPQAVEPPPTAARSSTSSSLQVAESGVGLRIVGTRLEGEGDRFTAGQRVTFATRILGGASGDHIRHVWLRDGKVEQSIRLRIGGASWRTWSTKTLGRPGAWTVEARDEQDRVLAHADLTVAP
ncbi:MAG TPA: DUF2914 domain-containing protein [Candidatus Polarisedimenticolia bacterium]|nr:DUF2914 domain-containing protein [Candidatus Polarisedimenticolia bacterium]